MAPRGGRPGAFSLKQAELRQEMDSQSQQEREASMELGKLGLVASRALYLQRKVVEELEEEEHRDESGFFPEEDALVYVTAAEASRDDGEECQVVYKRVAIRKNPSLEARVLGAACEGEVMFLLEWDETRTWRRLHYRLRGGWGGLVHAWVLMKHSQLGTLVRAPGEAVVRGPQQAQLPVCPCGSTFAAEAMFCSKCGSKRLVPGVTEPPEPEFTSDRSRLKWSGREQPRGLKPRPKQGGPVAADGNLVLMSALELSYLAMEDGDEEDMSLGTDGCVPVSSKEMRVLVAEGGEQYEVVYKPFIAVRSQPSIDGKISGTAMYKQRLDTFGWDDSKEWRRVLAKVSGSNSRLVEAWVLVVKPGVGALLQLVPEVQLERLVLKLEDDEFLVMG
mmetsp:Transcript_5655/g.21398  ORF Transcript_5655/g.21398 Transcript_5655/m.21398 type:complete len:390 (+) Transcript_5655:62-1231(+)